MFYSTNILITEEYSIVVPLLFLGYSAFVKVWYKCHLRKFENEKMFYMSLIKL
jgi:hypothetical protein